jgi:hypothetical protein
MRVRPRRTLQTPISILLPLSPRRIIDVIKAPEPIGDNVPTFTRYDHAARLAFLEARGEVSREEATNQIRAVCAELADLSLRHPTGEYGVLLDTRESRTVPMPADIIAVLDEIGRHAPAPSPSRWAILATEPAHYGMGRLFETHAEARGIDVRVFATLESAVAWLSSPTPRV